jgi:NitT/TauT family transport system substrate-binding protein
MSVGPVDAGAIKDYQGTADFLVETGALPKALDVQPLIDTSFTQAFK